MAGAGGRCLSDLPDDMLQRILYFAPAREGATTAVLSRQWRWLWRTSGAVNLDLFRSFCSVDFEPDGNGPCSSSSSSGFSTQDLEVFLHGAEKVLTAVAAHGPIRRLTLSVTDDNIRHLMHRRDDDGSEHSLVDALVSNPAARLVEELHVEVHGLDTHCTIGFGSLPSEALRVLRIIFSGWSVVMAVAAPPRAGGGAGAGVSFPQLAVLHLQQCRLPLVDLQTIVDAAPQLSTLHLESSHLTTETTSIEDVMKRMSGLPAMMLVLRCPAVTALTFADCTYGYDDWIEHRLELDVPRLQYFRYRGHFQHCSLLSLKSQA